MSNVSIMPALFHENQIAKVDNSSMIKPFLSIELRLIPPLIFIGEGGQKRRTDETGGDGKIYLSRPDGKFDGDVLFIFPLPGTTLASFF